MLSMNEKKQESAGSLHAFFVAAFPKLLVSFLLAFDSISQPAGSYLFFKRSMRMKKKIWHFYLVALWNLQNKITRYAINKWSDKGFLDSHGFITELTDDRN